MFAALHAYGAMLKHPRCGNGTCAINDVYEIACSSKRSWQKEKTYAMQMRQKIVGFLVANKEEKVPMVDFGGQKTGFGGEGVRTFEDGK